MSNFVDGFGRSWTQSWAGDWSTAGISFSPRDPADAQALAAAIYPDGFVPPTKPVAIVPLAVTAAAARIALFGMPGSAAGKTLLDDVNAAVTAVGGAMLIYWEYSTVIERASPMVAQIAAGLGLAAGRVDALFIAAQAAQV